MLYTRKSVRVEARQPHWLLTFGDLMALIACVFIVFLSVSEIHKDRFTAAAGSLHQAFGGTVSAQSASNAAGTQSPGMLAERLTNVARISGKDSTGLTFSSSKEVIEFTLGGESMFEPGRGSAKPDVEPIIREIGQVLAGEPARIIIRGHAFAESNAGGDSPNDLRALSFARADAIASTLEKFGVESSRMRIEACGDAVPLSQSPQSEIARAQNRRVEIEIRPDIFSPFGNENFPKPTR